MNNTSIKRYDITIKLRGDNVYDLYLDGEWVASGGTCEKVLDAAAKAIREKQLKE